MLSKYRKILLFSMALCCFGNSFAQTFPIQVNVFAIPPHSNTLSDYYSSTRERLVVNLLNRDVQRGDISVRLRVKIEASNGLVMTSKENVVYPQLFLTPNVPERLSQELLAPYFMPQNLNTQGYFNGKFPNGMLYITITAVEQYTGKVVSAPAMTTIFLTNYQPPLLRQPSNNQVIALQNGIVNQLFQWELQNRPAFPLEYEFELRELPNNNAAPQSAFLYSPIIHQETLSGTSLFYNSMMYPFEANKTYGWRVRAIAKDGIEELNIFENNGFSEIRFFRIDENCQPPFNVTAKVDGRTLIIKWNAPIENNEFVVQYRLKHGTSDNWQTISAAGNDSATIAYPQKGEIYEIRVGGICTSGASPVFSPIKEAAIPAVDSTAIAQCGMPPDVDISNQNPLQELKVGDVITAGGGFKLTITKVTGSMGGGVFAGEGWVFFGWVLEAKMAVEFDDLRINTDYRQIGGIARAKYDASNSQIGDIDNLTEGGRENTNNGITRTEITLNFTLPQPPEFAFNAETGEFMVKDADGNWQVIQVDNSNGVVSMFPVTITDADGNMYLVEEDENGEIVAGNMDENREELGDAGAESSNSQVPTCGCPEDLFQNIWNGDCSLILSRLQSIKTAYSEKKQLTLQKVTLPLNGKANIDSLCIPNLYFDMSWVQGNEITFNPAAYKITKSTTNPYGSGASFWAIKYENILEIKIPESETNAEKKIRALAKWLFEEKSDNEIEIILDNVQWVGQFDESVFGQCTGCWRHACCRRASEYMLGNTNVANCSNSNIAKNSSPMAVNGTITLATFSNNNKNYNKDTYNAEPLIYRTEELNNGIQYMINKLQQGRPIIIGAHYINTNYGPPNNPNKATRHFVVIVGYVRNNNQEYFLFYEPATSDITVGASQNNRLSVNRQEGYIRGTNNGKTYTITGITQTN